MIGWLFALGGAALNMWSTYHQSEKEKAAILHQKESAEKQYKHGKQYSDDMYSLQKTEALGQLGIQRSNLNTQLGSAMDDYNTSLLGQAFGIQDARIQTGSGLGASIAAEGASGTRGDAANEMMRAYAAAGLERNIDTQNRQNSNYLNNMITGANQTASAISREEASWSEGGYKHQQKTAQDDYNKNIYELGQSDYQWAIDNSKPEFLDYFTSALSGASTGFSLWSGLNESNKIDGWWTNETQTGAWDKIKNFWSNGLKKS